MLVSHILCLSMSWPFLVANCALYNQIKEGRHRRPFPSCLALHCKQPPLRWRHGRAFLHLDFPLLHISVFLRWKEHYKEKQLSCWHCRYQALRFEPPAFPLKHQASIKKAALNLWLTTVSEGTFQLLTGAWALCSSCIKPEKETQQNWQNRG